MSFWKILRASMEISSKWTCRHSPFFCHWL
jgi:hypothetical protein